MYGDAGMVAGEGLFERDTKLEAIGHELLDKTRVRVYNRFWSPLRRPMEKQNTNLNQLIYNYYTVKGERDRIAVLYNTCLSALRECLVEEAYPALMHDACGAGRSYELVDEDTAQEVLNDLLGGEEFERLLKRFDPEQDLIAYIKGLVRKDYRSGIPKHVGETVRRLKHETSYPLDENGEQISEERGFGVPQEDALNPLEQLCRKAESQSDSLRNLTDEEISDRLWDELFAAAERWAAEDEMSPTARHAREMVYTQALQGLLEVLKAGKDAFTPSGKLRLDPEFRQRCAALSGRSDRMVRSYLRDLEPRLEALRH